jgi:hypothetical protein
MDTPKKRHSFFWPIVLIGAGVVWLLVNFNIIEPITIGSILQFWPLLLVLLGLDILFGRRFAWLGSVFGVLAVGAVIFFLVYGPKYGWTQSPRTQVDTYTEPLGETTSVTYDFSTSSEAVELFALTDASQLIDANIAHQGVITFDVRGDTEKTVRLYETTDTSSWVNWNLSFENYEWNIGLNPTVPTDLILDSGSGSVRADLSGLMLESLVADTGSGSVSIDLPESATPISVTLSSGSGSISLDLSDNTAVTIVLESGSGSVHIDVPDGAEVRVELLSGGSGSLSIPGEAGRVSGDVETGAWETSGYSTAAAPILIQILDQGSGSISIN